jgi:hypothetical protein
VVLLEYMLDGKTLTIKRVLTLCGVCFFVLLSSKADLAFSVFGRATPYFLLIACQVARLITSSSFSALLCSALMYCTILCCAVIWCALFIAGTVCASIWVPLAAAYKTQWGRVRKQLGASTLQLMHAVLPWAMILQFFISYTLDPPGVLSFHWTAEAIFWIGLSGII